MPGASTQATTQSASKLLPLTSTQSSLLRMLTHPDCVHRYRQMWTISEGLRVKPGVSSRRAERVLQRLVRRHDILRLAFTEKKGEWHAVLQDENNISLKVEDHGDVSDAEMRSICRGVIDQTIEITNACLCDFRMLRFGNLGDVILMRVHHSVTDGYGMMVLAEDFIKFFLNLPMQGQGYSHLDYLAEQEAALPEHRGEIQAYWNDLLFPAPPPVPFGRIAKGMPTQIDPSRVDTIADHGVVMSPDDYSAILNAASKSGASFFTLFTACFGEVVRDKTGADDIIGQTILARAAGRLSNYAGSDIRFPYFRTRIDDGTTLMDRAVALSKQIRTSSQYLSKELAKPVNCIDDELFAETGIGPQFFVHVGAADGRAKSSMFKDLFRSQGGKIIQIGPVEIERMVFPRIPAMILPSEISLVVVPYIEGVRILLRSDATVFDEAELASFVEPLLEKLNDI